MGPKLYDCSEAINWKFRDGSEHQWWSQHNLEDWRHGGTPDKPVHIEMSFESHATADPRWQNKNGAR